jgi:hypothetical protein
MNQYETSFQRGSLPKINFIIQAENQEEAEKNIEKESLKFELLELRKLGINVFDNNPPNVVNNLNDEQKLYSIIEYAISNIPNYKKNCKKTFDNILNMIMEAAFQNLLFFNNGGVIAITSEEKFTYRVKFLIAKSKNDRIKLLKLVLSYIKKIYQNDRKKLNKIKIIYAKSKFNFKERTHNIKLLERLCSK